MDLSLKKELLSICSGKVFFDEPMRNYTSLKVGGKADVIVHPKDVQDLRCILNFLKNRRMPYYILGRGTNLLVKDGGIRGVVIHLGEGFKDIHQTKENGNKVFISAGTGVLLRDLLAYSVKNGLSGLEFAAGIPGAVGGALAMNAGTKYGCMEDVTYSIAVMNQWGKTINHEKRDLEFSYRKLKLRDGDIILEGIFELKRAPKEEIRHKIGLYISDKRRSQPLSLASCGCIFKNPKGYYAGQLIEDVGLKGYRIGGAMVSNVHANFIVNVGEAKARDILDLMALIGKRVKEEKGIELESEVKIIGEDA
ncbi:MAG TPA: UDP-N-acetylmuramate dehydrogenase [Syntrophaceae bacterium]|nr:UDP-N-acetylmuramate dehydrogenase [Syntrophaceae bacterium]